MFKQTLNRGLNFLPVDVLHVLINLFINEFHCCFESLNSGLKFFELFHHSLDSDIDDCLNESPLSFFKTFTLSFVFHTGLDSVSLAFMVLKLLFFLYFVLDSVGNDFLLNFFLSKRILQQFAMIKLDDFDFLFLFVKNVDNGRCCVVDFQRIKII